jgi:hypothetical protein
VSDDGSSHLGPDEAMKREQAERLLADVYDVVVLLVGAYAGEVGLTAINPYSPYPLPPKVLDDHSSKLGIVHDTIMAWTTEALEHAGVPQPRRPADKAGPVFDFKRLIELGSQDIEVQAGLDSARLSVEEAKRQLARVRPNTREWYQAKQVLEEAIKRLRGVSLRLVQLDVDTSVVRIAESQQEPAGISGINVLTAEGPSNPFGSAFDLITAPAAETTIAKLEPDSPTIVAWRDLEKLIETEELLTKPSQRVIKPGPSSI